MRNVAIYKTTSQDDQSIVVSVVIFRSSLQLIGASKLAHCRLHSKEHHRQKEELRTITTQQQDNMTSNRNAGTAKTARRAR